MNYITKDIKNNDEAQENGYTQTQDNSLQDTNSAESAEQSRSERSEGEAAVQDVPQMPEYQVNKSCMSTAIPMYRFPLAERANVNADPIRDFLTKGCVSSAVSGVSVTNGHRLTFTQSFARSIGTVGGSAVVDKCHKSYSESGYFEYFNTDLNNLRIDGNAPVNAVSPSSITAKPITLEFDIPAAWLAEHDSVTKEAFELLSGNLDVVVEKAVLLGSLDAANRGFTGVASSIQNPDTVDAIANVQVANIKNVYYELPTKYLQGACWVMSKAMHKRICAIADADRLQWRDQLGEARSHLLGHEVVVTDSLNGCETPLIFGDFKSGYQVIEGPYDLLPDPYTRRPNIAMAFKVLMGGAVVRQAAFTGLKVVPASGSQGVMGSVMSAVTGRGRSQSPSGSAADRAASAPAR